MQQANSEFKKLFLSAALALAVSAPAMAQTNVKVVGLVDVFTGSMRAAGDTGNRAVVDSGGMTTSWLGFQGSEDIGGGLKANFNLTSFLRADTGAYGRFTGDTTFSRDANVGLSGGFGAVSLGRDLSPSFLPLILFNPFGDSFTFSPLILHAAVPLFNTSGFGSSFAGDVGGWSNEIRYTTPNFGGLTANFHYQFGETAGNNSRNNVGANVLYFAGPLSLTAFYHNVEVNNPVESGIAPVMSAGGLQAFRQSTWFVGGGYDFGVAKLYATYDQTEHDVDIADKTASLGVSVPLGNGKVLGGYAQTKRSAAGSDITRNTATVGYDYNLSKRTDVYAMLMNDRITGVDSGNSFGVGMRHSF